MACTNKNWKAMNMYWCTRLTYWWRIRRTIITRSTWKMIFHL